MEKIAERSKEENSGQTGQNEPQGIGDTGVNEASIPSVIINIEQDVVEQSIDILITQPELETRSKHKEKAKENVLDYFTEKQIADIVQGRQRVHWVFRAEPTGGELSYSPDRNDFVAKVFGIVAGMLAVTFGYALLAYNWDALRDFHESRVALMIAIGCAITIFIVYYVFICSTCGRILPCNIICLVLGCGAYSFVVGAGVSRFEPHIIMGAVAVTLLTVVFCFGLAFTSIDFTKFLAVVMVAMFACSMAGLTVGVLRLGFGIKLDTLRLIILIVSSVVLAVGLIIELQMVLGGRTLEFGEEDYAYAAWMIYTSIITMFLKILDIINQISEMTD